MAASCCLRQCSECILSCKRCSPTPAIRDRNSTTRCERYCHTSKRRSSSVQIKRDLRSCPSAGSSSVLSPGSTAAEGSPRIGRTSIAKRSYSCAWPQSASCSENSAIPSDLSGQTLTYRRRQFITPFVCEAPHPRPRPAEPRISLFIES